MATVAIEIPSRSAYVAVVRLALASLGRAAGLDEELVDDLKIAVSEACANAVLANGAGSDAPVTVAWTELANELLVEVSDRGIDQGELSEKLDDQGFSSRSLMSTALLGSLARDCRTIPREGGGSTTQLVFAR